MTTVPAIGFISAGLITLSQSVAVIMGFHRVLTRSVAAAVRAAAKNNEMTARTVTSMKQEIQHIVDSAAIHQA